MARSRDDDWGSHIDRINPGENPADIPGIWIGPHPSNDRRLPHRLTQYANVHGVVLPPGTTVMLFPHELSALRGKIERVDPPRAEPPKRKIRTEGD